MRCKHFNGIFIWMSTNGFLCGSAHSQLCILFPAFLAPVCFVLLLALDLGWICVCLFVLFVILCMFFFYSFYFF